MSSSAPAVTIKEEVPAPPPPHPWGMFEANDIQHQDAPPFLPDNYVVEALLKTDRLHGKRYFLVKWQGYGPKENTWQLDSTVNHIKGYKKWLKKLGVSRTEEKEYMAKRKEDDPILAIYKETKEFDHVFYKVEWDIAGKKKSWVHHSVVQGTPIYNQWQFKQGRISRQAYEKAYLDYHGFIIIDNPEEL